MRNVNFTLLSLVLSLWFHIMQPSFWGSFQSVSIFYLFWVESVNTVLKLFYHINPGMVEALASKTMAWEKERAIEFLYDGVSTLITFTLNLYVPYLLTLLVSNWHFYTIQIRLLSMLEEYTILRQEKEQEQRRLRVWY